MQNLEKDNDENGAYPEKFTQLRSKFMKVYKFLKIWIKIRIIAIVIVSNDININNWMD